MKGKINKKGTELWDLDRRKLKRSMRHPTFIKVSFLYLNILISSQKWHWIFHMDTCSRWGFRYSVDQCWTSRRLSLCPCHSGFLKDLPVFTIIITNYSWHLCLALIFKAAGEVWKGHRNEKPRDYIICLSNFFFYLKQISHKVLYDLVVLGKCNSAHVQPYLFELVIYPKTKV